VTLPHHLSARLSRRRFLQAAAALAAAAGVPLEWAEAVLAADPSGTTLDRTIARLRATGYSTLTTAAGEPHIPHPDNPVARTPGAPRRTLVAFAHFTDIHLIDAQSPARVEFLDRFADGPCRGIPFSSAWRPQETMTTQVLAAMVAAVNDIHARRIAGGEVPLSFAVATGDNCDNQQANELAWFIAGMDGGRVEPGSGGPGYQGVQAPDWGDTAYWVPAGRVADVYKSSHGFPAEDAWGFAPDGLLAAATAPFASPGLAVPWYVAYGNHDGLLQGNAPNNPAFAAVAVGGLKPAGPPPGLDPCGAFRSLVERPADLLGGPARPVTPDPARRIVSRAEYLAAFLGHGHPGGFAHGVTPAAARSGTAYYTIDHVPGFRFIVLDTVNPGGYAEGSIGQAQFDWLAARLAEAGDRYVILFSHHGLHSLSNPNALPDPLGPEPERRVLADEVEALLHAHPGVIAWVCGHTHQNRITLRRGANGHVFWDIETAAHVDWPCQARIVEVIDDGDVVTIRLTMVDHAAPVGRAAIAAAADPVLRLAGIHRELAANDPQIDRASALGPREARNVELTVPKPASVRGATVAVAGAAGVPAGELPATGDDPSRAVAAALAVAGGLALAAAGRPGRARRHPPD
jgi:metallophosphoesterase (TIGR03767 family)